MELLSRMGIPDTDRVKAPGPFSKTGKIPPNKAIYSDYKVYIKSYEKLLLMRFLITFY